MELVQHIRKTDLARNTSQVIRDVLRGRTAVVESHGQAEVAIIDIIDYRIQRALISFFTQEQAMRDQGDRVYQVTMEIDDVQVLYNQALGQYLAGLVSLSRTAEILDLPVLDLRMRFTRLGIPLRQGVESIDEIEEDVLNTLSRQ